MDHLWARFVDDLVGRIGGPMSFRFFLQPTMALIYACRDGLADARAGRPAYFWAIFHDPAARVHLLEEGWKAVLRIILLGVVMDTIYQVMEFRTIHPLELIVIVLELAFVPYLVLRGPINRVARWLRHEKPRKPQVAQP